MSETARRIGVNKSTVSRQVRSLGIEVDEQGRFSFAAYEAARAAVHSPLNARGQLGGMVADEAPASAAQTAGGGSRLGEAATAHKAIQARILQIDLDERLGKLIDRQETLAGIQAACRELRDMVLGLPGKVAVELINIENPQVIEDLLQRELTALLDRAATKLGRLVGE